MMEQKISFSATIEQSGTMNAAYIVFPYDVFDVFGAKGQVKVKAMFDDAVLYRGSLAKMNFPCHVLGITKEIRAKLGKTFGDTVEVIIERDTEERIVEIPADIAEYLNEFKKQKEVFDKMSYSHKKEYIQWIESAKKAETRANRIVKFVQMLEEKAAKK